MRDPPQIIAACGLELEARIARGANIPAICGGARAALLRDRLTLGLASGRTVGLVSFGLAGGLDPSLAPGKLVFADRVIGQDRSWDADALWLRRLVAACDGARSVRATGSDVAVDTQQAKERLQSITGASIVDMESHIVAEIAAKARLPFAVIRAVADTAQSTLPSAALIPLHADGRPQIGRILLDLARRPGQMGELISLARASRAAASSLRRVVQMLGPSLGCPDFL